MKKTLLTLGLFWTLGVMVAQVSYQEISSAKLNTIRQLKIKLPQNYDPKSDLKYPLILVFDGDYLFEPVVGHIDFQTYFDDMPESIVVGVIHGKERFYDSQFDELTGLPYESGYRFHQFVERELLPYLESSYKLSEFKVAVGHNIMANLTTSFLFKEQPVFQAYISISPDFKGELPSQLLSRLSNINKEVYYYMATADGDHEEIRSSVMGLHSEIDQLEDELLTYYFDHFEEESHYTLVTGAVSRAFDKMFDIYKPLRTKELQEKALPYEGTLDRFLTERYDRIETLFGIERVISEEEIEKVVKIAEQREDLESLYKLGKLSQKLHPESPQGIYYLALHAERIGKMKKAAKLYTAALEMEDSPIIDREFILSQVEKINLANQEVEELEEEEENEEN